MTGRRLSVFLLALILPAAGACGSGGEPAPDGSAAPPQQAAAGRDPCGLVMRAEAEAVLGTLVAEPYRGGQDTTVADPAGPTCVYPTEGGRAFLLMVFEGLHSRTRALLGASTRADSLELGNEGWGYGSGSGSEAAVRAGEKVYHARMAYPLSTTTPGLKGAMVRLVAAMMN